MATHSSVLAWRIPGMGKPGELPSRGRKESDMTAPTHRQHTIIIEKVGGCNMSSQLSDTELSQSLPHPTPAVEQSLNGSQVFGIRSELATHNTGIQGPV